MANSKSVVTIDQHYVGNKLSNNNAGRKKMGRSTSRPASKKLYTHSSKEALNPKQVEQLVAAAMQSPRSGLRDAILILLAYQHGLKVSELINLKWEHIDFENRNIIVSRLRNGQETLQPLGDRELKLLGKLEKENSTLVFQSQRRNQLSSSTIRKIIKHAGEEAGFKQTIYPNMLTGASGFNLISATMEASTTRH